MKFNFYNLKPGPMVLTGSKVLKAIQDLHTQPIDLFVREIIQNSADAILENKDFGVVKFDTGEFNVEKLSKTMPNFSSKIIDLYNSDKISNQFIAIKDMNTTGLLGNEQRNVGPQNFFNLVYDMFNTKHDTNKTGLGGSCGVGKSIYYRYGRGVCFYYSRTFENNKYINKLAGAIIQDENSANSFIVDNKSNSTGIAYLGGTNDSNGYCPIYDEKNIEEFLSIFNLKLYSGTTTGTVVIIPFFKQRYVLSHYNCSDDETVKPFWLENITTALSMCIQRWYFPRINNEKYNGKYLKIFVNDEEIKLCRFFEAMQNLYNGVECQSEAITGLKDLHGVKLGTFNFKIFDKEELKIYTPPYNFPPPRFLVDSSYDCDANGLLIYTRKPGMIINYENDKFGKYSMDDENKYLIGIFVLNDEATINNENLGSYIRETEKSNHDEWKDISSEKKYPIFSKPKNNPFKQIQKRVSKLLGNIFKIELQMLDESESSPFKKIFANKLLPPLDFGDAPSIAPSNVPVNPTPRSPRRINNNSSTITFAGVIDNDMLAYDVDVNISPNNHLDLSLGVQAGSKNLSFYEWQNIGFDCPCKLIDIKLLSIKCGDIYDKKYVGGQSWLQNKEDDFDKPKIRRNPLETNNLIYRRIGKCFGEKTPYGLIFENLEKQPIALKIRLVVKPVSNKYSLIIDSKIERRGS